VTERIVFPLAVNLSHLPCQRLLRRGRPVLAFALTYGRRGWILWQHPLWGPACESLILNTVSIRARTLDSGMIDIRFFFLFQSRNNAEGYPAGAGFRHCRAETRSNPASAPPRQRKGGKLALLPLRCPAANKSRGPGIPQPGEACAAKIKKSPVGRVVLRSSQ